MDAFERFMTSVEEVTQVIPEQLQFHGKTLMIKKVANYRYVKKMVS